MFVIKGTIGECFMLFIRSCRPEASRFVLTVIFVCLIFSACTENVGADGEPATSAAPIIATLDESPAVDISRPEESEIPRVPLPRNSAPLQHLSLSGGVLADGAGNAFRIRGMTLTAGWRNIFISGEDKTRFFETMLALGVNTVRVSFGAGEIDDAGKGMDAVEATVNRAAAAGIYSILHMGAAPGEGYIANPVFEDAEMEQRFCEVWSAVAARFRENPAVIGYSLMDAPRVPLPAANDTVAENSKDGGESSKDDGDADTKATAFSHYSEVMQKVVDAVRDAGTGQVIFIAPLTGYYTYNEAGKAVTAAQGAREDRLFPELSDPSGAVVADIYLSTEPGKPFGSRDFAIGARPDSFSSYSYDWYDEWAGYGYTSINHGSWHMTAATVSLKSGDAGLITPYLTLDALSPDAVVYVDNLTLEKETFSGRQVILKTDFSDPELAGAYGWPASEITENPWKPGDRVWKISMAGQSGFSRQLFPAIAAVKGEKWIITAEMRVEGPSSPMEILRIKAGAGTYFSSFGQPALLFYDREGVLLDIERQIGAASAVGLPFYFGEVKAGYGSLGQAAGAEEWAKAVSPLVLDAELGFAWYAADGAGNGLFTAKDKIHPRLMEFYREYFGDK